jgi:hypothetical protein
MADIRKYYGVPAKRGAKIKFQGIECKILSARGPYLRVKGPSKRFNIHPTWQVEYMQEEK